MEKVRGLALQGGGLKGYYQAHVIRQLWRQGKRWKFAAGTSIGAYNCFGLSLLGGQGLVDEWDKYISGKKSQYIKSLWYKILWTMGLNDISASRDLLFEIYKKGDKAFKIPFWVCVVEESTGEPKMIPHTDPDIIDYVVASGSMPTYMHPHIGHYDGGVFCQCPVKFVHSLVGTHNYHIDVVLNNSVQEMIEPYKNDWWLFKWVFSGLRAVDYLTHSGALKDLRPHGLNLQKVSYYYPDEKLYGTLEFNKEKFARAKYLGERTPPRGIPNSIFW